MPERFDLEAARRDLGAFAAMLGRPLEEWQLASLRLETLISVLLAPRGAGKSTSLALLAAWRAFVHGGHRTLIVSASEESAKRLLAQVQGFVRDCPPLAPSVLDEQSHVLRLSNQSEVRSVSATDRSVRGWRAGTLIVDEAARVSDDVLEGAAFPTTSATPGARILLADTAGVTSGTYYDLATRGLAGSEHVRTYRWALEDCTWISPTYIAQMREILSSVRWQAEMLCEFVGEADAVFTRAALERVTVDYVPLSLAAIRPPAKFLLGLDWASSIDHTAAVAIGRLAVPGRPVFGVACAKRWASGHRNDLIIEEIVASPAHWAAVTSETNGVGQPLTERLFQGLGRRAATAGGGRRRSRVVLLTADQLEDYGRWDRPSPVSAEPGFHTEKLRIHTSAESKAATWALLKMLVDREQLLFPAAATELLRELQMLRVALSPSGGERIEAGRGHDDVADALAAAAGPHKHRGQWLSALGTAVEQSVPLPEPTGPVGLNGPTVVTEGGLTIPRQPSWLSVNGGGQVTGPPRPSPEEEAACWAEDLRARVRAAMQGRNPQPKEAR